LKKNKSYTAKDIEILKGLDPVRKRPGMYVGSTDEYGLHHLINEILDNSIDEILSNNAKNIFLSLLNNNIISIEDDGRGIPTDKHPKFKNKTALEIVMTTLHSGGKFNNKIYNTSGGLHGVGLSVVNALSENLEVKVFKNGIEFSQKYKKGVVKNKITKKKCNKKYKGTKITFKPDDKIFDKTIFNPTKIYNLLKVKAYLVKGSNLHWFCDKSLLKNIKIPQKDSFYFKNGIKDYLNHITKNNKKLFNQIYYSEINLEEISDRVELAINFNEEDNNSIQSFCNSILTKEGGTHETALKSAIMKSIKLFAKHNQISKISNISQSDFFDYCNVIISLYVNYPSFEGQTKQKLSMPKLQNSIEKNILDSFSLWLSNNKKLSKKLIESLIERSLVRTNLNKIIGLERKSAVEKHRLPGKLVDCSSKIRKDTELFIVEGDSAGGSAKQARNREKQAILPLRGKILNVYNATLAKIADNQEIQNLIQALGCGFGRNFDIKKLRYDKIILMTDADVDGSHIATLLITFFYKFMPQIIHESRMFLAVPPLFKIIKNNQIIYAFNEKDKKNKIKKFFNNSDKIQITRFKGLGEMPSEQLKNTTMDPDHRSLLKIKFDNKKIELKKVENIFSSLMGNKAELRFKFIKEKANFVTNIDI